MCVSVGSPSTTAPAQELSQAGQEVSVLVAAVDGGVLTADWYWYWYWYYVLQYNYSYSYSVL